MDKPRLPMQPVPASLALLFALAALAAEPAAASSGSGTGTAALDAQISAELERLEGALDPVSAGLLRDDQASWSNMSRAAMAKAGAMVEHKQAKDKDLAELSEALRTQRLAFLHDLPPASPQGVAGGWGNALGEVLVERGEDGRAKLVSITYVMGSRDAVCVVEGPMDEGVGEDEDGFTITPARRAAPAVHVRRKGIALVIEERPDGGAVGSSSCTAGARLSGAYFPIEGAQAILPWLMH